MKSFLLLAAIFCKLSSSVMTGDVYVLAYSWQAQFCYGQASYPGCFEPEIYWEYNFTLHGLWPQYSTSGYPSSCTTEPFNTSIPNAVGYNDMVMYWPNVKASEGTSSYDDFWDHEWTKHGTCTGLSQFDYFTEALDVIKAFGTESIISDNVGQYVDAQSVRDAYGGKTRVTLVCSGGKYISELYTCWNQTNGFITERIDCPPGVQSEDTCTATQIYIQSFNSTAPASPSYPPAYAPTAPPYTAIAQPGDLSAIAFNSVNPDEVVFVALVSLPTGFTFYVTDNGWTGTSFRSGEGTLTCLLAEGLSVGQTFSATSTTCKLSGSFDFSVNGDQILVYAGSSTTPSWLYGVTYTGAWATSSSQVTSSSTSMLPDALKSANVVLSPSFDNYLYYGTTTGTAAQLLAEINTDKNWQGSANRVAYSSGDFTVQAPSTNDKSNDMSAGIIATIVILPTLMVIGLMAAIYYVIHRPAAGHGPSGSGPENSLLAQADEKIRDTSTIV